jgi:hypothetical protein
VQITNKRSYAVAIGNVVAQPGEAVDVDDDVGQAALKQPDNWAKPSTKSKSKGSD